MNSVQVDSYPLPKTKQLAFQINYIWTALRFALFAGFAIGAHLTFVIGYDFNLGDGFVGLIQTHGHVQLVGWAGLFIMGMSLHFMPRLTGMAFSNPKLVRKVLWLMTAGLIVRSIGQSVTPYIIESKFFVSLNLLVAASGMLEFLGIIFYLILILGLYRESKEKGKRQTLKSIAPFMGMMLTGWFLYGGLNLILLIDAAVNGSVVLDDAWNEFAIKSFIGLVLLPVAFAFSIRTFPLYLRLNAPNWNVRGVALVYLVSLSLEMILELPTLLSLSPNLSLWLSNAGSILKGCVIIWFIWQLDLLTRRKDPWTVNRVLHPAPDRRPTRPGLPDYGEFGSFERLIYAAYFWLALGAVFEIVTGIAFITERHFVHLNDAIRHMYLLGFVTNLILGMSVRMIPGFIHKKKVAIPKLVGATFWLVNIATLGRILPLMLPPSMLMDTPILMEVTKSAFAFSGIFGIFAVLCLWINLRKTNS